MAVISAQGTTFTIQNSGGTPQTIGGVQSFNVNGGSAADIKTTTLADTAHQYKQGLPDAGELTVEMNFLDSDAGQTELIAAKDLQATRIFVLTYPTGTLDVWTFSGYVKSYTVTGAVDDIVKASSVIRISGAIVRT